MATLSNDQINTIIKKQEEAKLMVTKAEELGKQLQKERLTTNQIRAIFGEVRQIESEWGIARDRAVRKLILLKPKMAYRARKEHSRAVENLVKVLDPALDVVINEKNQSLQDKYFENFVDFFEAILAYHKAYGGR